MKKTKNSITLFLMTSSIVLLFVLQAFWLTNSYEKANFELRREANTLFRTTIFALRDSFFMRNIESTTDSQSTDHKNRDTAIMASEADNRNAKKDDNRIQVFISSAPHKHNDSVSAAILRPLVTKIQVEHLHGRNKFFIRMDSDSLALDTIKTNFQKALTTENIQVDFKIKHNKIPPPPFGKGNRHRNIFRNFEEDSVGSHKTNSFSNAIQCDWVHYNPLHRYSVTLTNFRSSLIKEIMPQIFFAVFLTFITVFSFAMLYRSIRSQQRLMDLKNDFISNMTHELKTPIATVSVALEALKNFKGIDDPKRTEEYLNIAQHELNRLTILTDNVLNTSLFEENRVEYITESVDLEKLMNQVLGSMKLVFEKNKSTVEFIKNGSDFIVQGSSIHLTNVIYNLLDNAIKYSNHAPVITIFLFDYGVKKQFIVKDQGVGIAAEYVNKIFEKFFRVPSGNIHTVKGYGLGLSYVSGVVLQHGGTIRVDSEPGAGSTFSIELPKTNVKS